LRKTAVGYYEPVALQDREAFQRLVSLLAQQKPDGTEVAFTWAQRGKAAFGVEDAAAAYVQVLRLGAPDEQQIKAIGRFLEDELQARPQSTALRLSLADYYGLTAEPAKAVEELRAVLAREPDNVVALNNLAWTLSLDRKDRAKVQESLTHIQRAIDLAGPLDDLLDTRARILFESGQREAGLRDMCEAVQEAPSAARWRQYAEMLREAGQTEPAQRALAEAQKLGAGNELR
jgi:tetratricopeptide (TPR) repeat protein